MQTFAFLSSPAKFHNKVLIFIMIAALDDLITAIGRPDCDDPLDINSGITWGSPSIALPALSLPPLPPSYRDQARQAVKGALLRPAPRLKKRATPEAEKTPKWKAKRALNTVRSRKSRHKAEAKATKAKRERGERLQAATARNIKLKAEVARLEECIFQLKLQLIPVTASTL